MSLYENLQRVKKRERRKQKSKKRFLQSFNDYSFSLSGKSVQQYTISYNDKKFLTISQGNRLVFELHIICSIPYFELIFKL